MATMCSSAITRARSSGIRIRLPPVHDRTDSLDWTDMFIGLTYDLRQDYLDAGYGEGETAEFDRPDTIEAIENALRALGHETDRIGRVTALVERLARGDRWDLVFNIAEGLHG